MLHIRPARTHEAPVLSAIALQAKAYWGYPPEQIARWRTDLALAATDLTSMPTFVAEWDGEIAGFYSIVPSSQVWALNHLWIATFMRRGIGRALFEHAASTALRGGGTCIAIDADPHAEPFYLACGATRIGTMPALVPGDPDRVRPQLVLQLSPGMAS